MSKQLIEVEITGTFENNGWFDADKAFTITIDTNQKRNK